MELRDEVVGDVSQTSLELCSVGLVYFALGMTEKAQSFHQNIILTFVLTKGLVWTKN